MSSRSYPMKLATFTLAVALTAASCISPSPSPPAATALEATVTDKSVVPGDDFFEYANGGWLKETPIPPDKSQYGIFTAMEDETRKQTVKLIQDGAAAGSNASADMRKIGDFYSSFMDQAAIE